MILQKRAARKITSADFIQLENPTEETSPESEKIVEKRERGSVGRFTLARVWSANVNGGDLCV